MSFENNFGHKIICTRSGALEGPQEPAKKIITKWNREKAAANFGLDHDIFGQNCDMCTHAHARISRLIMCTLRVHIWGTRRVPHYNGYP